MKVRLFVSKKKKKKKKKLAALINMLPILKHEDRFPIYNYQLYITERKSQH